MNNVQYVLQVKVHTDIIYVGLSVLNFISTLIIML